MEKLKYVLKRSVILMMLIIQLTACKTENKISSEELLLLKESVSKTNANWQLFMDDYWISGSENIISTIHQPKKSSLNPLIKADVVWEQNPYCFGTVIFDEQDSIFKFWYQTYNYGMPVLDRTPVLYASSKDGIEWKRPNLGIFEFEGSTDNNILLQNYGFHDLYSPSVIKDNLEPDPNKRYKMVWWDYPLGDGDWDRDAGMCIAFSSDGIHWNKHPENPVLHAKRIEQSISDVMSVMQDKNTGKYVAYTKGWKDIDTPNEFRQIVRTESTDFVHWSSPEVVITHNHNNADPQSYGMTTSQYGNNYIGMLYSYKKPGNETIDVQLTISHDNKSWNRVANQKTFIPLGKLGSWDDGMIFCAPLFNYKNQTLIYYGAWDNSHDSKERRRSGIGLAMLRLNGFVSLDAKSNGSVTTKTVKNAEGPLLVNVNAKKGVFRTELLDINGKSIPGYSLNDCIPIKSDNVSQIVEWKNKVELPKELNTFQIRFELTNASLYGFYAGAEVEQSLE